MSVTGETQVADLLDRAKKYMKHGHKCLRQPWFDGGKDCSCGLEELLVAIDHIDDVAPKENE